MNVLVEVDVATCRPPKIDARTYTWLSVDHVGPLGISYEAEHTAMLMAMAHPHIEMVLGARIIDWEK